MQEFQFYFVAEAEAAELRQAIHGFFDSCGEFVGYVNVYDVGCTHRSTVC